MRRIIRDQRKNDPIGLLYSGGLDSSILAKIMMLEFPQSSFTSLCVGLPDSYDLRNAANRATELGFNLYKRIITVDLVSEAVACLRQLCIISDPVSLTIAIPLFIGLQTLANEFQIKTVFLGQGADELFGGYQRYVKLYSEYGEDSTRRSMIEDLHKLLNEQVLMEAKIAQFFKLNLIYPFLFPQIITRAQSFPVKTHIVHNSQDVVIRKALLRRMARKLGLPENLSSQPKKAIQYGSGTVKLLRAMIKNDGYQNIPDWFSDFQQ
ncbi:MAG: asparagine synthase [Candidatus Heimdallarchaeota archaeon]|nr:MAG: asparagine synthase [Candidatus Heimdallarchaeota archaeon]